VATGARTDTGRVRDGNEDRYLVREERGVTLLAVADGVGGSSGGEVAADAALVKLGLRFFGAPPDRATSDALAEAMRDANAAVLRAASASGHHDAATTIVAAAVRADQAIIANLGDSRAYLIRDGASRQLTEDHSGEMAHAITRFAGDVRGIQPDIYVESLRPTDRLLLCSDGLTRHVTPEEIAKAASGEDVRVAANALVDLANARGGQDNITVLVHAPTRAPTVTSTAGRAVAFIVFALLILVTIGGAVAVRPAGFFGATESPHRVAHGERVSDTDTDAVPDVGTVADGAAAEREPLEPESVEQPTRGRQADRDGDGEEQHGGLDDPRRRDGRRRQRPRAHRRRT